MPTVAFAPYAVPQFLDNEGKPIRGGTLETYLAGTSTPAATYADNAGTVPNPTTIQLDSSGRPSNNGALVDIRLDVAKSYKFVLKDKAGAIVRTVDEIFGGVPSGAISDAALADGAVGARAVSNDADEQADIARKIGAVQRFATIADMTASKKPSGPAIVTVEGYYTVGDGGGGTFFWDASSSETDDGGMVLASGAGGTGRWKRLLFGQPVTTRMFGAKADATTNDTSALVNFFHYCCYNAQRGHITGGVYMVERGAIVIDYGWESRPFPIITTDGYQKTIFRGIVGTPDAPYITISNGDAQVGTYRLWEGGYFGGIRFEGGVDEGLEHAHGFQLTGIRGCVFEGVVGYRLGGDTIYIPRRLFGGTNPDPYEVGLNRFNYIEGRQNFGRALHNDNFVGFSHNWIGALLAADNQHGGFKGAGTCTTIDRVSVGNCRGWAIDLPFTVLRLSRMQISNLELDTIEYGISAQAMDLLEIKACRIVHRFHSGEGVYWPKVALSIAGDGRAVTSSSFEITHRIEAGGTKADLGVFTNLHNAGGNISDVSVKHHVVDNAGFGISGSDLYTNLHTSSVLDMWLGREQIISRSLLTGCVVAAGASVSVPNTGYGTAAAKLVFPSIVSDRGSYYSATDGWFTVPAPGLYRVRATIALNVAAGVRVRLAIYRDVAGTLTALSQRTYYSQGGGAVNYNLDDMLNLNAGDRIFLMADQNTAAPVALSGGVIDNRWSIEVVK